MAAKLPEAKWFEQAKFGIFIHWGTYSADFLLNLDETIPRRDGKVGTIDHFHKGIFGA
ncbi:MAG: hypothetical protein K0R28_3764 [Paenibacillus sp.]|jgi:hypothetical protein|nr:hypothetical protein [Paenibacillus sp.]